MRLGILAVELAAFLTVLSVRGADESGAYFAPENIFFSKLVRGNGETIDFVRDPSDPRRMVSQDGWFAERDPDGMVVARSHWDAAKAKQVYRFKDGHAVSYVRKGKAQTFGPDTVRRLPPVTVPPLELSLCELERGDYVDREMAQKWAGTGRLQWPYQNPNFSGALYSLVALALLAVFTSFRGRSVRTVSCVLGGLALIAMAWSGSRGAMLGFAVGVAVTVIAFRRVLFRSRRLVLFLSAGVVLFLICLACFKRDVFTRGFDQGSRWSNELRTEMWKTAPSMMYDAPGGWNFCRPGAAYFDWYQPVESMSLTGSLMNDHVNFLVSNGWIGRTVYLFAWLSLIGLGLCRTFRDRSPGELSVLVAAGVMAVFNPILSKWTLWIIPLLAALSLVVFSFLRRFRLSLAVVVGALLMAGVFAGTFWTIGKADLFERGSIVSVEGSRILVNGSSSGIWIVDDERDALGGIMDCKGIRAFYRQHPDAPAVGYVTSITNLPTRVDRLVLAGRSGMEWLVAVGENPEFRRHLPREVFFISPPFPPSQIPEGVVKSCQVRYLVGELAAAYEREFSQPRDWVQIIPGMELYIASWMSLVVGG